MNAEQRIRELHIELPAPPGVAGNYVPGVHVGSLVFMSSSVSRRLDGSYIVGKVGSELNVEDGYAAARGAGMFMLSRIRSVVGSLNNVQRVVKVLGMVNATPDFKEHPKVIDGFSDLMVEVFGESGRGARATAGMMSLSKQVAVEVEMVLPWQRAVHHARPGELARQPRAGLSMDARRRVHTQGTMRIS